jgi:hypothetical protein
MKVEEMVYYLAQGRRISDIGYGKFVNELIDLKKDRHIVDYIYKITSSPKEKKNLPVRDDDKIFIQDNPYAYYTRENFLKMVSETEINLLNEIINGSPIPQKIEWEKDK